MGEEIKELNNEILRTTQSVVVHTPNYSKFGGYEGERDIYTMDIAKALYTAGYRKQREGRWTPRHKDTKAFCAKCGALRDIETQEFWSFCPNCGAKMKGGSE